MARVTEAIYTHGALKPTADLELRERQRVRVIAEPIGEHDGIGPQRWRV